MKQQDLTQRVLVKANIYFMFQVSKNTNYKTHINKQHDFFIQKHSKTNTITIKKYINKYE